MKYTESTFRQRVDEMLSKHLGIQTLDLPDVSLWEYIDTGHDYTDKEITDLVIQASIDVLVEADWPIDLTIELTQDLFKMKEYNTNEHIQRLD
jgi:hypothetical protein